MPPSTSALPYLTAALIALASWLPAGAVLAKAPIATLGAAPARDTLIPSAVPYKGYRLHVRDAKLLKQKRDRYLLSLRVVNTGSRAIGLGPGFPVHFLQTAFDDALSQSGLLPLAPGIRRALIDQAVTLPPGGNIPELEVWVTTEETPRRPIERTDDIAPAYRKRLPPEKTPNKRDAVREEDHLYASAKPVVTPPLTTVSPDDNRACVDLEISTVKVLQRDKRSALVELSIVNSGRLPLTRDALGTGAALDVYLGGSESITAASERLARVNLSARLGSSLGRGLQPGKSIALTERLDLAALTRYTRVLVAQLDPGGVIRECDATNNETSVLLKK